MCFEYIKEGGPADISCTAGGQQDHPRVTQSTNVHQYKVDDSFILDALEAPGNRCAYAASGGGY
eukprot:11144366-Karenia_brevis.AAC.1